MKKCPLIIRISILFYQPFDQLLDILLANEDIFMAGNQIYATGKTVNQYVDVNGEIILKLYISTTKNSMSDWAFL